MQYMKKMSLSTMTVRAKWVYLLGLVITLAASIIELAKGRAENMQVFYYSSQLFWGNCTALDSSVITSPYCAGFSDYFGRYFLYTPVFSVLLGVLTLFPLWLAGLVWNVLSYTILFFALKSLPLSEDKPMRAMLYLMLLTTASVFCFQYNVLMTAMFLWAFILLERGRGALAVAIIMVSATTKLFGLFELALLFCYRDTLRNFLWAVLFGALLLISPALRLGLDGLLPYYGEWLKALSEHNSSMTFNSLLYIRPFDAWTMAHMLEMQLVSLLVLTLVFFFKYRSWGDFSFRAGALAVIMGWICLFGNATEAHTYIIAFAGYIIFYYTSPETTRHPRLDNILYWGNWLLFGVMPIDILCPGAVFDLLHKTLWIDIYFYTFTWGYMIYSLVKGDKIVHA